VDENMRKLYHTLCKAEVAVCGVGFVFLVIFVFMAAILRFFRISMSWNIDLAMLLLAWTAFLGADIAWRAGQLVGIDIVTRQFPRVVQKLFTIVIYILVTLAMIVILVFGIRLAWTERIRTYQSMPIPYSLVTLSLVVTASSMVVSTILKIKRAIINWNKE
jgi:TRAP-type C4-dicarboxylate transport system permease small subunit